MKVINEHIKSGEYSSVYLIYGEEDYLKKQYKDKLKNAIIGEDTMNYSYFEGKECTAKDIIQMGDTLPFFADKRLIIIERFKAFNIQTKITQQEGQIKICSDGNSFQVKGFLYN